MSRLDHGDAAAPVDDDEVLPGPTIDEPTLRLLELHEARAHAVDRRTVEDLGHAILLHDPELRDPYWTRISALRWPVEADAFEARLLEMLTLFASLGRRPHVWSSVAHQRPADLGTRLMAAGFLPNGSSRLMLLHEPARGLDGRPAPTTDALRLERIGPTRDPRRHRIAAEIALVLADSFGLPAERRPGIAAEMAGALATASFGAVLARIGHEPVAIARRTTFDGISLLSSIGVRPERRGRGLGRVVAAAAVSDALAAGAGPVYLEVDVGNEGARRMYEGLGFRAVGRPATAYLFG